MANPALEREQAKMYNDVIAKYNFTAVGGGAPMAKSPDAITLKPGIRLHFLRYGLFYKKSTNDFTASINKATKVNENGKKYYGNEVIASNDAIPSLENFYVARTSLNAGYIYLFNAADPEGPDCHEFEVQEDGSLSTILWANNKDKNGFYKDTRKSESDNFRHKVISEEKTFWFAYSPVQWTEKYLQETRKDATRTEERMQKVECRGMNKGGDSHEHAISYKELYAVHYKENAAHEAMKHTIKMIDADERRQDAEDDENELFEDMFVTLDDPVGCANDINDVLSTEIINHQANIEAIRFGKEPKSIADKIKSSEGVASISKEEQEISDMFSLALTTYQLVYNDPESIEKYDGGKKGTDWNVYYHMMGMGITYEGNGILKDKLTRVLAIDERKAQRKKIRSLQKDLHSWISSTYHDQPLVDFVESSNLCNLMGKINITGHLRLLALNPHDIDRSLDLRKHQEKQSPYTAFVKACLSCEEAQTNLEKTIDRLVDIDEKVEKNAADIGFKLAVGAAGFANNFLESIAKITTEQKTTEVIKDTLKVFVTRLNRVTAYGIEMYELRDSQLYKNLPDKNTAFDFDPEKDLGKYAGAKPKTRFRVDSPHIVLKQSSHGKHLFNMPVETTNTVTVEQPTAAAQKAKAFVNSKAFRGTVGILQVFNLGVATVTLHQEANIKNITNLVGVTAELSEAVLKIKESQLLRNSGKELTKFGKGFLKGSGIAAAGITVIMCAWDAYDSFGARDNDAAWAYVGAGAAFTGVTVAAVFASASWAGPLGWICAGIGLGLIYLAYVFTDTPLENYFKHFIFSDRETLKIADSEPTWSHNALFYKDRQKLMGADNDMMYLADCTRAAAELHDLLVCSQIRFESGNFTREESMSVQIVEHKISQTITTRYAQHFDVFVGFNQFLSKPGQFVPEVYYFENGIEAGNAAPLKNLGQIRVNEGTAEKPPTAQVRVNIPSATAHRANAKSCILFICRLRLHSKGYYPTNYDANERWLGAVIGIRQSTATSIITIDATFKEETRIAPKQKLLDYSAWREKN